MGLSASQLKAFADFIQKELGIVYSNENFFQLEKRLTEVSRGLGLSGEEALYEQLQQGISGTARQLLLDVATNNETSFFRDPKAFQAIEKQLLPAIRAANPGLSVIRIWSAASSFGQEPYSLAILFAEMQLRDPTMPRVEIVATDISEAALARARAGRYSQLEVQRGLGAPQLIRYFTKGADDFWTLKPEIRIAVQFKKQNLLDPFAPLGNFELILCRNVLIYQKDAMKAQIVDQLSRRLTPGGFLLLGAAESLLGVSDRFHQICREGAVYFEKKKEAA
jgi:chemotaxis protein methyltransferase CheR